VCPYHSVLPGEPPNSADLSARLRSVEDRIRRAAAACGRDPSEITLVAVTKKFSAQIIREAYAAGLRDFGENYVQEFAAKQQELNDLPGARFHLIGHLQSNKARLATDLFNTIETVDTVKLLQRLDAIAAEQKVAREALIEVKLSLEQSKTGAAEADLSELAAAARACGALSVTGLMTVPPWSTNQEESRPYFRRLRELARRFEFSKLSMGMSGDFEVAIEEGATSIRVGTALFGPRPKPAKNE
jgi:PLP dependent protein